MTWAQLGRHAKPMVFANINGFWDPMLELVRHMRDQGFIHRAHLLNPLVIDQIGDIVRQSSSVRQLSKTPKATRRS